MSASTSAPNDSPLPPLYAAWVGELLGGAPPSEHKATCSDCAMCARGVASERASPTESYFTPVTKCCTYLPELANYLVGGVLLDDSDDAREGRRTLEARIDARLEVSPLGLGRSRLYSLKYQRGVAGFGQTQSMRCPHHLDDGRCGVWRHRESTCATWFCKHERGEVSKRFWRRVHELLQQVESCLSRHAVLALGLPSTALEALFPVRAERRGPELSALDLDERVDERAYAALWGPWLGRERDLYRAAAQIVRELSFRDVLRLGGRELELLAKLTSEAYRHVVARDVPERVRHKPLQVLYQSATSARVSTYSAIDPLALPTKLLAVLHELDGRPTAEALAAIAATHGVRVTPGVVRKLLDFGLLDEA